MHEIHLSGIDGFLAAIGTLRVLTNSGENHAFLKWECRTWWCPVIVHARLSTSRELIELLASRVCGEPSINSAWNIGNDLTLDLTEFGAIVAKAASDSSWDCRSVVDFLAAFGTEAIGSGPKRDKMSDTAFRTMSGAGHQHFLGFMKELAALTDADHLRRALFEPWDYLDDRPSLRWDPADFRPHALRAEDPSGDPIKTMRGANRLAVEALPLFPTVPEGKRLGTVGFAERERETEFTWPIWTEPLSLATIASVLASDGIQIDDKQTIVGQRSAMARRGIGQIFRARRFTEGKYRNFSPARTLL